MDQQQTESAPPTEWEVDDRGKPCKWQRRVVITPEDMCRIGNYQQLCDEKSSELDEAIKACHDAVDELLKGPEIYILIVAPEVVSTRDLETMVETHTVRARVRWTTAEGKANRERNLKAMFDAVDDELNTGL
jgi:galactose-1-phosphate uridylyltransferase